MEERCPLHFISEVLGYHSIEFTRKRYAYLRRLLVGQAAAEGGDLALVGDQDHRRPGGGHPERVRRGDEGRAVPPGAVGAALDAQLHRLALTAVDCRSRPAVCRHDAIEDAGLEVIHRQWVKIMADAFVRQTRFDPLYAAEAEQELHDRLAPLVEASSANTPITVEMQAAGRTHGIQLEQEVLMVAYPPWIEWLREKIKAWQQALAVAPGASHLLVTHRLAGLPGFVAQLENATGLSARKLPPGAAAAMSLAYADRFATGRTARGVPYLKRVTAPTAAAADRGTASATAVRRGPTHLLYQGWAYPITTQPLEVGREPREGSRGIRIRGRLAGISRRHFTVVRQDQDVLLTDTSSYGTRVDDVPVAGSTVLQVGQTLRIGSPGEILQAIACLPNDETTIP